jgi:hypothetical protein
MLIGDINKTIIYKKKIIYEKKNNRKDEEVSLTAP